MSGLPVAHAATCAAGSGGSQKRTESMSDSNDMTEITSTRSWVEAIARFAALAIAYFDPEVAP